MLASEVTGAVAPGRVDPSKVARALRDSVLPCGVAGVEQLFHAVEAKQIGIRALETVRAREFPSAFDASLQEMPTVRSYRSRLVADDLSTWVRALIRQARDGAVRPDDVEPFARELVSVPHGAAIDLVSEILHAAAPDRVGLLSRWVWSPELRTGALTAFGEGSPTTYVELQRWLGEVRFHLARLGFPAPTFVAVDIVLALSYATHFGQSPGAASPTMDLQRILPGPYPLAAMLLGVRRRMIDADR